MIQASTVPATRACAALEMERGTYYAWRGRTPRPDQNLELRGAIHEIALEFPGYGYRRVTHALRRQQVMVNHKRVLRIMREEHLLCKRKSFKPRTTNSNHHEPTYPNLITALVVTRPNQLWVADITYIGLAAGFVYLATLLDRFSRKCIGWALGRRLDAQLCLEALQMAIAERKAFGFWGLIHHSDRGVQYTARTYLGCLSGIGAQLSMTQTGNPRENAHAESFFKTLKVEEVYLKEYETFEDAYRNIKEFIEKVYNAKRLHSSIGYRPPNELEAEVLSIR